MGTGTKSWINIVELANSIEEGDLNYEDFRLKKLIRMIKTNSKVERRSDQRIKEMADEWFSTHENTGYVEITVNENCSSFNAYCFSSLKKIFEKYPIGTQYMLDMSNVRFISSGTLGMLIELYKNNGSYNRVITLSGCNRTICNILQTCRFEKLFIIK